MSLDSNNLQRLARLTPENRAMMGWVLMRYAELEGVREADLLERLEADKEGFLRLHLCKRPRGERFVQDVQAIAGHVGVSAGALAMVLRRVEVIETMAGGASAEAPSVSRGMLMAARARKPKGKEGGPS